MKKITIIVLAILGFLAPFALLFSLEYLSIWNEWSVFIPNDDKMRSWVDKNVVVQEYKEKYPDALEEFMPYAGTRHYWIGGGNASMWIDLNNAGDIKYIHLSCTKNEDFICASSAPNYPDCKTPLNNEQLNKMVSFVKSDSCK